MIPYQEALDILLTAEPLGEETQDLKQAVGCVTSQKIASNVNVPPFDNSAMDGFAVKAHKLLHAAPDNPITLTIDGSSAAGDAPGDGADGAWEIMTGAPVPPGYDAVVKIEDVQVQGDEARFTTAVDLGNNIRRAGQDFSKGQEIISKGTRLSPFHLMALATIGKKEIPTACKPRISIYSTGKELVEDFDQELKPGQIRNSNGLLLETALNKEGYDAFYGGIIYDEPDIFEKKIEERLPESDIIISTGAVSAGKYDFIPDTVRKLGADAKFHKVMIQPGKPIFYAKFKSGQHYFGLPGNPISAVIGLRFFILPLLHHLQGYEQEQPLYAKLDDPITSKPSLKLFRKAHMRVDKNGVNQVRILDGQESFKIHPMLEANCWAVIDQNQGQLAKGEVVRVYPLFSHVTGGPS